MKKKSVILFVFFFQLACYSREIHPLVFSMIHGESSGSTNLVVTEINLDAAEQNRNLFDYDKVTTNGAWVEYRDDNAVVRYKTITTDLTGTTVELMEKYGGTDWNDYIIQYQLGQRTVMVDGVEKTIHVLKIISISAPTDQPKTTPASMQHRNVTDFAPMTPEAKREYELQQKNRSGKDLLNFPTEKSFTN